MLRTLDIENIAVIEKASVNFSDGLKVKPVQVNLLLLTPLTQ